jgi:energy-coupling factor transporter ATP-binding protein EcfA2
LLSKFPGKTEQEYRQHLGNFQITGQTGLQLIGTLSGGQKSRVAFAALSLARPHILLLDEPTNHLDMEGLDALIVALENFNGGVIVISHDERFVTRVGKEVCLAADRLRLATDDLQLWVCGDNKVTKFYGDVKAYKVFLTSSCPDQDFLILDTESDRQQREDEAVGGSGGRRSPVAEVAWWFGCDDAIGTHEVVVAWNSFECRDVIRPFHSRALESPRSHAVRTRRGRNQTLAQNEKKHAGPSRCLETEVAAAGPSAFLQS